MAAVEVAHLVKRYRAAPRNAVDDISFEVPEGELFRWAARARRGCCGG